MTTIHDDLTEKAKQALKTLQADADRRVAEEQQRCIQIIASLGYENDEDGFAGECINAIRSRSNGAEPDTSPTAGGDEVEELARVIARTQWGSIKWDDLLETTRGVARKVARAVLSHLAKRKGSGVSPPGFGRPPDGYSTDEEGGLLEDLLDEYDHGAITEITPYWCGERQWAVVHYDEDGLADHQLFDSEEEAKKFRAAASSSPAERQAEVSIAPEALSEGGE